MQSGVEGVHGVARGRSREIVSHSELASHYAVLGYRKYTVEGRESWVSAEY